MTSKLVVCLDISVVDVDSRERLIEVVKQARVHRSQRAFADVLGVSATAVQFWEKGEVVPNRENLAKIAVMAGFSPEELNSHLSRKPTIQASEMDKIISKLYRMPLSQVAKVVKIGVERLADAMEGR